MESKSNPRSEDIFEDSSEKEVDAEEDASTVDTDTSEIMKRLEGEGEGEGEGEEDIFGDSDVESEAEGEAEGSEGESEGESDAELEAEEFSGKAAAAAIRKKQPGKVLEGDSDADSDEDTDDEDYLQKLDESVRHNIIGEFHPEMVQHNDEEVETLCRIVRDADGVIIDPFHKTLPFVTKYEKARILGERAKQINSGAKPFVKVEKHVIDGYLIALQEFEEKKIPFIIRRPLPNGASEYWKLADLQILD